VGLSIRLIELLIVIVPVAAGIVAAINGWVASKRRDGRRDEAVEREPQHDDSRGTPRPFGGRPAVVWQTVIRVLRALSNEFALAKLRAGRGQAAGFPSDG